MKIKCKVCNVEKEISSFEFYRNKTGNFYCSRICMGIGHGRNYSGANNPFYGKKHTQKSLEKMTGKNHWNYGNKSAKIATVICKNCGKKFEYEVSKVRKGKQNGEKLHVHHIDYNKNNNVEDNLISLCKICHCCTNGNREYWTKYFSKIINHKQKSATTIPTGSTLQANGSGSAEYPYKRDNDIVCSDRKLSAVL